MGQERLTEGEAQNSGAELPVTCLVWSGLVSVLLLEKGRSISAAMRTLNASHVGQMRAHVVICDFHQILVDLSCDPLT